MFNRFPSKPVPQDSEGCKIKVKHTKNGKEIIFSGKCSKEQLEMAKSNSDNSDSY